MNPYRTNDWAYEDMHDRHAPVEPPHENDYWEARASERNSLERDHENGEHEDETHQLCRLCTDKEMYQ